MSLVSLIEHQFEVSYWWWKGLICWLDNQGTEQNQDQVLLGDRDGPGEPCWQRIGPNESYPIRSRRYIRIRCRLSEFQTRRQVLEGGWDGPGLRERSTSKWVFHGQVGNAPYADLMCINPSNFSCPSLIPSELHLTQCLVQRNRTTWRKSGW